MSENLFLVVLKDPPVSLLVDNFDTTSLEKEVDKVRMFKQEGRLLFVTKSVDANIAYVQEITKEVADRILKRMEERSSESKIVRPEFSIPGKRGRG